MDEQKEKALISLGQEHHKLVEKLKMALLMAQRGFLKAAEALSVIKDKRTHESEDLSWQEFCGLPDLPIPGRTSESRRRVADALVRIHKIFVLKSNISKDSLIEAGWTKLDMIAPVCEKEENISIIEDWVERARRLTVPDLWIELKQPYNEVGANSSCQHEKEYLNWRCPICGQTSKDKTTLPYSPRPLNPKHKTWRVYLKKLS